MQLSPPTGPTRSVLTLVSLERVAGSRSYKYSHLRCEPQLTPAARGTHLDCRYPDIPVFVFENWDIQRSGFSIPCSLFYSPLDLLLPDLFPNRIDQLVDPLFCTSQHC